MATISVPAGRRSRRARGCYASVPRHRILVPDSRGESEPPSTRGATLYTPTLVVSDPPHGDPDAEVVADILGLEPENARLKISFPAPEVLDASDPDRAGELARKLREEGLSVQVMDGSALADLPWPEVASLVELDAQGMVLKAGDGLLKLRPEERALLVSCQPPAELARDPDLGLEEARSADDPSAVADAVEWMPHLDLLLRRDGARRRFVIVDDVPRTLAHVEERLPKVDVDRRLDSVRPRQRFVAGEADFDPDLRKAFSYGTLLLRHVLDSIDSELRDIPQYEFATRLSYALRL